MVARSRGRLDHLTLCLNGYRLYDRFTLWCVPDTRMICSSTRLVRAAARRQTKGYRISTAVASALLCCCAASEQAKGIEPDFALDGPNNFDSYCRLSQYANAALGY